MAEIDIFKKIDIIFSNLIQEIKSMRTKNNLIDLFNSTGILPYLGYLKFKDYKLFTKIQLEYITYFISQIKYIEGIKIKHPTDETISDWKLIDNDGLILLPIYYSFNYEEYKILTVNPIKGEITKEPFDSFVKFYENKQNELDAEIKSINKELYEYSLASKNPLYLAGDNIIAIIKISLSKNKTKMKINQKIDELNTQLNSMKNKKAELRISENEDMNKMMHIENVQTDLISDLNSLLNIVIIEDKKDNQLELNSFK